MKDLKLIENTNNLELTNFDFGFTEDTSQYVAQKLSIKLRIFQGEWYLDNTVGIPYFESVLVSNPNVDLISDLFKAAILEVAEVEEIVEFEILFDKTIRKFTVDFTVKIITGETVEVTV